MPIYKRIATYAETIQYEEIVLAVDKESAAQGHIDVIHQGDPDSCEDSSFVEADLSEELRLEDLDIEQIEAMASYVGIPGEQQKNVQLTTEPKKVLIRLIREITKGNVS